MDQGLHIDMRPQSLDAVRGQEPITNRIKGELKSGKFPHATLFTGASGVGKTTVARILRDELGCDEFDYMEQNMASFRGIDEIRSIASGITMAPLSKCRVYVLDECHQITKTGQQALLKVLEDCPKHAYFILLTSEPDKLIKAIKTRCSSYNFSTLPASKMESFLRSILSEIRPDWRDSEGNKAKRLKFYEELVEEISINCGGSPRMGLVMLQGALACGSPGEALDSVSQYKDESKEAMDLFNALLEGSWRQVQKCLKDLWEELKENYEGVRRMILALAGTALVKGWKGSTPEKAMNIIDCFESNHFDSGRSGFAASCFACCN